MKSAPVDFIDLLIQRSVDPDTVSREELFSAIFESPADEQMQHIQELGDSLNENPLAVIASYRQYEEGRTGQPYVKPSLGKATRKHLEPNPPQKATRSEQQPAERQSAEAKPFTVGIETIEPKAVDWLWPDFIPIGCGILFSGDPGSGKTFFLLDLAARLTRGSKWADGCPVNQPGNVLFLSFEDDAATTIRPHFDSLGGDPSRLHVLDAALSIGIDFVNPLWLIRLENEVLRIGDVRLVVLDPIIDFSPTVNPNKAEAVRALLNPLISMAARLRFALVLVSHLNKAESMSAIYRAGGSTGGWLGKCRAAFLIFRDVDDRALRHVSALKANLAQHDPPQLEFRLNNGKVLINVSTEYVSADDHLNPKHIHRPREKENAVEWLGLIFKDRNEIPAQEVFDMGKEKGFSEKTLKRAKAEGGFISKRADNGSGWVWMKFGEGVKDAN